MEIDSDEEHIDSVKHEKLLKRLAKLDRNYKSFQANNEELPDAPQEVELSQLVQSIKSAPDPNQLKTQLLVTKKRNRILPTPVHRQQRERIERQVVYGEARKDLNKWQDIVQANRLSDQLVFPLNQEHFRLKSAEELTEAFVPRTRLEIESAELLGKSKHNLTNKEEYTEAEKEIIKAMSLKEAKEKCAQMQKLRALMSYRESKFRRQKKIKSKRYHRLIKKQKGKQLLKDWETLKTTDPEAAREKLELLEQDRIKERATLKHRGTGKWSKQLRKLAKNNPDIREKLEEQLRQSRKLGEKHGDEDSSDEGELESEDEEMKLERLFTEMDDAQAEKFLNQAGSNNPWMSSALRKLKHSSKPSQAVTESTFEQMTDPLVPLNPDWNVPENQDNPEVTVSSPEPEQVPEESPKKKKRKKKKSLDSEEKPDETPKKKGKKRKSLEKETGKKKKKSRKSGSNPEIQDNPELESPPDPSVVNVDDLFDSLEGKILDLSRKSLENLEQEKDFVPKSRKSRKKVQESTETENPTLSERLDRRQDLKSVEATPAGEQEKSRKTGKSPKKSRQNPDPQPEVMVDPKQFLNAEAHPVLTIAPELVERMDQEESNTQESVLADAFADDDVIAEFESQKQAIVDAEKPKDIDLELPGWGDWAGPGITANPRKKKRFVIKAPEAEPRRDKFLPGVIISEKEDTAIRKLQVSEVPFPFTSVSDFEATVKQPLGKEWNAISSHKALTAPGIVTKAGAIIKPMDREITFKEKKAVVVGEDSD